MDSPWFTTFSYVDDVQLRLFCFHYAGGSSNVFRTWQAHMPKSIEIVAVELPGRGKRLSETCQTDLLSLVEKIGAELTSCLDVPFAFFGHSMGALLSFELARLLRKFSLTMPEHLFLSAHKAPHLPRESEPLHTLPESAFVKRLYDMNGTPKAVLENDELRTLFLPVLRADFAACETYQFKASMPLDCPITVFGGKDDHEVDAYSLREWEQHTTGSFHMHLCSGDHFFIHAAERSLFRLLVPSLEAIAHKDRARFVSH